MSVYSKGKGKNKEWRYDFVVKGQRYSGPWLDTKQKAIEEMVEHRKEVKTRNKPQQIQIPTDMGFLELVNRRLDHAKAYNSERHYADTHYMAKRWVSRWGHFMCSDITQEMIEEFVLARTKVSHRTANKELRYLRATFNFGLKRKKPWISDNPTEGVKFLPEDETDKYVPEPADIEKVISVAKPNDKDYLLIIKETIARVGEINRMTWKDVDLLKRTVTLYTRKKKGGGRRSRKVHMNERLFQTLQRRLQQRDPDKPWVFWHRYWSRRENRTVEGPFGYRKRLMASLCRKAGVKHFTFHALRHSGASLLEQSNVPVGTIQKILGHENRSTTEIYLDTIGDAEREAMSVLESASRDFSHTIHTQTGEWVN